MVEACGPVQTAEGAEYYVEAFRAANNTPEMQALIEALFWLSGCVEQKGVPNFQQSDGNSGLVFRQGLIDEKFVAKGEQGVGNLALSHVESDQAHW